MQCKYKYSTSTQIVSIRYRHRYSKLCMYNSCHPNRISIQCLLFQSHININIKYQYLISMCYIDIDITVNLNIQYHYVCRRDASEKSKNNKIRTLLGIAWLWN